MFIFQIIKINRNVIYKKFSKYLNSFLLMGILSEEDLN